MSNYQIDWDFILNTVRSNRCVILVGPEVAHTEDGVMFRKAFLQSLDLANNDNIAAYYEGDELFLFPSAPSKTRVYYKLKDFYQQTPAKTEVYDQLARLPLKLWVNASVDTFLAQALERLQIAFDFDYFNKSKARPDIMPPTKEQPLLYNLVGIVDEEESLLLTHGDLYQYLEAVLSRNQLPGRLLDTCLEAHSVIFLGINFEKWYVQLLLRLLRMHDEQGRHVRYSTEKKLNADTLSIVKDQFQIEFISDNIDAFVQELYDRCEAEGLLRNPGEGKVKPSQRIRHLLQEDEIGKALEMMQEFFEEEDEELADETSLLMRRFNRLNKRMRQGVLDERDSSVQLNNIVVAVQDLIKEMEQL